MNVHAMMGTIGKAAKNIAGKAANLADDGLDLAMRGVSKLEGPTNRLADKAGTTILSQAYNDMAVLPTKSKARLAAARYVADINHLNRIEGAIGGGVEGAIVGAAGGAVIGGVSGGISDDETFLGGMGKSALAGAGLGLAGGGLSGALHKNPGLVANAAADSQAVAARISKWKVGMGDGLSNAGEAINRAVVNSPMGEVVKPGSTVTMTNGVKMGTQFNGQMRFM